MCRLNGAPPSWRLAQRHPAAVRAVRLEAAPPAGWKPALLLCCHPDGRHDRLAGKCGAEVADVEHRDEAQSGGEPHMNAPFGHVNAPFGHVNAPSGRVNAPFGHVNAPFGRVMRLSGT